MGKFGLLLRPLFPPLNATCPARAWWAQRGHVAPGRGGRVKTNCGGVCVGQSGCDELLVETGRQVVSGGSLSYNFGGPRDGQQTDSTDS